MQGGEALQVFNFSRFPRITPDLGFWDQRGRRPCAVGRYSNFLNGLLAFPQFVSVDEALGDDCKMPDVTERQASMLVELLEMG